MCQRLTRFGGLLLVQRLVPPDHALTCNLVVQALNTHLVTCLISVVFILSGIVSVVMGQSNRIGAMLLTVAPIFAPGTCPK
jgi:hypothetical protein